MNRSALPLVAALTFLALPAAAQPLEGNRPRMGMGGPEGGPGPGHMPMKPDYARALDISPEKAAQVEAVMEKEREAMKQLREKTRAELAKILTPEQLAKLDQFGPRGRPMGPPPGGMGMGQGGMAPKPGPR